jgi:hypothetical protein
LRNQVILVIVLLCFVVLASGCVSDNKQSNVTKNYNQNNVSFTYPGVWELASTTSPNAVVALADPNTIQNGSPTTLLVVQKPDVTKGSNLTDVYAANYKSFFNKTGYQEVSEGNLTINGGTALENIYKSDTGDQKEYRAVWFSKNSNIYVFLFSAKSTDFQAQQDNFNLVINSFN